MNEKGPTSKKILHGKVFESQPSKEVSKTICHEEPNANSEDDYESSADTETEMPLSQEGFDLLRSLKPLSSDELYSVVKTETEEDVSETLVCLPTTSSSQGIRFKNTPNGSSSQDGLVQNLNSHPSENLDVKGKYIFTLQLDSEDTPAKSCKYTYSLILNKLFAQMDKMVPINFKFELSVPGAHTEIRSYLIYKDMNSRELNVDRCPHHLNLNINDRYPHHIIDSLGNDHLVCPSTKRYVTVLKPGITNKNRNMDSFSGNIRFRCMSSCRGGIDRRTLLMVFELYVANRFSGRAVLEVVVCTSPGRDRVNQERKYLLKTNIEATCTQSTTNVHSEYGNYNQGSSNTNGDMSHPNVSETNCTNGIDTNSRKRSNSNCYDMHSSKKPYKDDHDNCIYGSEEKDEYFIKVKGFHNAILLKGIAERLSQLEEIKKEKTYGDSLYVSKI